MDQPSKPWRLTAAQLLCAVLPPTLGKRIGKRLYPFYMGKRDAYRFSRRSRTGSPLIGSTADFHAHKFSLHGYCELRTYAFAKAFCRAGDTVIEIGANVGTETVGLSDIVGERGRVIAFEPMPQNVEMLALNIERTRWRNIDLRAAALGSEHGIVQFALPKNQSASGTGYVVMGDGSDLGAQVIDVQCLMLDELTSEVTSCSLISMDAEGSEISILEGAREFLSAHKPAILCEANSHQLSILGRTVRDLHAMLVEMGYVVKDTGQRTFTEPDLDIIGKADWLCVHRNNADQLAQAESTLRRATTMPFLFGLNPIHG